MNRIFLLIIALAIFTGNTTYAAFPANNTQEPAVVTPTATTNEAVFNDYTYKESSMHATAPAPAPKATAGTGGIGLIIGIVALVFGILALATWSSVAAVIFGGAAIIVGVIGLNHDWKLFSLIGLIFGVIGAVAGLVSIAA